MDQTTIIIHKQTKRLFHNITNVIKCPLSKDRLIMAPNNTGDTTTTNNVLLFFGFVNLITFTLIIYYTTYMFMFV
jgi:hypothetical protein